MFIKSITIQYPSAKKPACMELQLARKKERERVVDHQEYNYRSSSFSFVYLPCLLATLYRSSNKSLPRRLDQTAKSSSSRRDCDLVDRPKKPCTWIQGFNLY